MTDLKCCPFCGGEAELKKYYETCDGRGDRMARVECKCGLGMSLTWNEFKQAEKDFDYSGGYYSSNKEFWEGMHQKLVDKWNTRTPMANIVEKLEERRIEYELSSENAPDAVSSTYRKGVMRGYEYSRDLVKQEINNGLE